MRSESLVRKSNYLTTNNNNNSPPVYKRSKSSLSSSFTDAFGMIPENLLKTSGAVYAGGADTEADTQRSNSLSALCAAMFTEWESQDYLDNFYEQLFELEGSVRSFPSRVKISPRSSFALLYFISFLI